MTRSEEVASACASVARATTREEARAALETLRARMFRAFEASEASTRSSSEDADDVRIDDVEDACACALTHGRGRWYETFSAGDRTRLVDDWFAARGLGGVGLAGAVRACANVSGRSTATARGGGGGGLVSAEETVVVESAVRYYVELARGGAIGALVRFAERAEERGEDGEQGVSKRRRHGDRSSDAARARAARAGVGRRDDAWDHRTERSAGIAAMGDANDE